MKHGIPTIGLSVLLVLAAGAQAQDATPADSAVPPPVFATPSLVSTPPERAALGFGVSLGSLVVPGAPVLGEEDESPFGATRAQFHLVIRSGMLKLEPEIGIFHYREKSETSDGGIEEQVGVRVTGLRVGTGVFKIASRGTTDLYFGARIGILSEIARFEFGYDDGFGSEVERVKASRTNFYVGPALGGEYFLSRNFSLGGEAQFIYTDYGDYEYSGLDDAVIEGEQSDVAVFDSRAYLFVRWYL